MERDSIERSSELLRMAIPLMARHRASLDPITYSVWYTYLSGRCPPLNQAVDQVIERAGLLDNAQTQQLYREFVAGGGEAQVYSVSAKLGQVIDEVSGSAQHSASSAQDFQLALDDFSRQLALGPSPDTLQADLRATLRNTEDIKDAMAGLLRVLDSNRAEVENLREQLRHSNDMALSDALTGLRNRYGFNDALRAAMTQAFDSHQPLCLLLLDLDHFKRINDTYGHLLGDKVLRTIARILRDSVRGADTVARFGGEEFAILLPDTPLSGAVTVAEGLCSNIARGRIRDMNDQQIDQVTMSIGVGLLHLDETADSFIGRVDAALYAAKKAGRNRVTVAASPAALP